MADEYTPTTVDVEAIASVLAAYHDEEVWAE